MFTCTKILWYLRVAWSIKSRTVHPVLQGTTTEVSPKVTVTFIAAGNASALAISCNPWKRFPETPGVVAGAKRRHLSVENWAAGVSGQEIKAKSPVRLYRAKLAIRAAENILNWMKEKREQRRVYSHSMWVCVMLGSPLIHRNKTSRAENPEEITASVGVQEIPPRRHLSCHRLPRQDGNKRRELTLLIITWIKPTGLCIIQDRKSVV